MLQQRGVELVSRLNKANRTADFRRGRRLGPEDHVVRWAKPTSIRALPDAAGRDHGPGGAGPGGAAGVPDLVGEAHGASARSRRSFFGHPSERVPSAPVLGPVYGAGRGT